MAYTLAQLRNEIYRLLGNPTDLDPTVDATELTRIVNEGQRQIATWKDPVSGNIVRFNQLFNYLYFKTVLVTDTVSAVNNTTFPYYIDLTTADNTNDDRYNDWVVEMTSGDADGEKRLITDYDATNRRLYLHRAFTTAPSAADTVTLYKRFWRLLPATHNFVSEHISLPTSANGGFLEVLHITDPEDERSLIRADRTAHYPGYYTDTGDPSEWYRRGNVIYVDYNQDTERWLRMDYFRFPNEMSADGDFPEIDEQYHHAIVLWGLWNGFKRMQETDSAYAAKRDLIDFMRNRIEAYDMRQEIEDGYAMLERGRS